LAGYLRALVVTKAQLLHRLLNGFDLSPEIFDLSRHRLHVSNIGGIFSSGIFDESHSQELQEENSDEENEDRVTDTTDASNGSVDEGNQVRDTVVFEDDGKFRKVDVQEHYLC
jgi:hypothetical protein